MPSLRQLPRFYASDLEGVLETLLRPSHGHIDYADHTVVVFEDLIASMKSTAHTDDEHHHGETVFEHVTEVLGAVGALIEEKGLSRESGLFFMLCGVMHDVTKPASHKLHPKTGKHQFPNHWNNGAPIARAIMERYSTDEGDKSLIDCVSFVVEHHHDFFMMVDTRESVARATNPYRRYGYVRKYVTAYNAAPMDCAMEHLIEFMNCDVTSAKDPAKRRDEILPVLEDIKHFLLLPPNPDKEETNRPYYAGVEAGRAGSTEPNPYTAGTPEHMRWSVGYDQGKKERT